MVPFIDLAAQHRALKAEIDAALARAFETSQFILGPEVAAFEEEFARAVGARFAVGLNSGTSALHLALLAAGVGPGDEVITVPFTFVATVAAILYTGARPVFVDVEPRYFTMDVDRLEGALTAKTKAILPVHLYGQAADMDPVLDVARRRNLAVIEDAAQAHLAEYRGRRVGAIGDIGCFSFYPGKNLGACGEGGLVATNDEARARTVRMLRDWGQERKHHHAHVGYNYRMEGLQAAILRVKLRRLESWTQARIAHAREYCRGLSGSLALPEVRPGDRHVFHIFAVRSERRDALQAHLAVCGVASAIHYPIPVHLQEGYRRLGHHAGDFPVSESLARTVLSLPMYGELTDVQLNAVCDAARLFATGAEEPAR